MTGITVLLYVCLGQKSRRRSVLHDGRYGSRTWLLTFSGDIFRGLQMGIRMLLDNLDLPDIYEIY